MLLSIYTSISAPLEVAFTIPEFEHAAYFAFNLVCDFMFILDIIVSFRTTYQNAMTGDEIFNSKKIAENYIHGRFSIDLLAAIPFDLIMGLLEVKDH